MEDREALERAIALVFRHAASYDGFRIPDAYKLVYQACMGPEHAAVKRETARQWLDREWESLEPDPCEELCQDITVRRPVFRINLRAAKARGLQKISILDNFLEMAREFQKDKTLLVEVWTAISECIAADSMPVKDPENLEAFDSMLVENDYPAVHHSREYAAANRPAYRLVSGPLD